MTEINNIVTAEAQRFTQAQRRYFADSISCFTPSYRDHLDP